MTEKRAGRELAKWVAVTLVVLLGLYVGTYYWIVYPVWTPDGWGTNLGDILELFFAPIHRIDRILHPDLWNRPLTEGEKAFFGYPATPTP